MNDAETEPEPEKIKFACFDMDWTLIKPKSGKKFPQNKDDWKFFNNYVKAKLAAFAKNDYQLAIFSNQAGVASGKIKPDDLIEKYKNIQKAVGAPMYFFAATGKAKRVEEDVYLGYRKPYAGLFNMMKKEIFKTNAVDLAASFYCGDAAGRKGDHSNDDALFSINIGVKFFSPEMLWDVEPANFPLLPGLKIDPEYIKEKDKDVIEKENAKNNELIEGFREIA